MKELSIEEKAKAYDEALKYARIYYKAGNKDMKMMMKTCFPILVEESEDEMTIDWCVSHFRECSRVSRHNAEYQEFLNKKIIPWLEKQGNKDEEILVLKDQIESLHAAIKALKEAYKIKVEKQGEQKPAWSEEDEEISEAIIKRISGESDALSVSLSSAISWVENVKDRVLPQPKQKWGKEDREMRMKVLKYLSTRCNVFEYEEVENWLKSLRPQSQWKPSDEQMEVLKSSTYCQNKQMSKALFELYQDLLKLREEKL